jgi:hypothetical protein
MFVSFHAFLAREHQTDMGGGVVDFRVSGISPPKIDSESLANLLHPRLST